MQLLILGHSWARTGGPQRSVAVHGGQRKGYLTCMFANYRPVTAPLRAASQAENAGSIPVTRSSTKAQVKGAFLASPAGRPRPRTSIHPASISRALRRVLWSPTASVGCCS